MIVITGAAGFIGSCLAGFLNRQGITDIVAVDRFRNPDKKPNFEGKIIAEKVEREAFHDWLSRNHGLVECIFHLGARTDTAETDTAIFERLNLNYSRRLWEQCTEYRIPLIYASSAATYGKGEHGFDDAHALLPRLNPLNAYARSKHAFDLWALMQETHPPFWAGLKFFNVYGPNEYHKGRMASVIYHAFRQVSESRCIRLFRSYHPDYPDGGQLRDFIYVIDVLEVCWFFYRQRPESGIYNVGTGKARTFNELASSIIQVMNLQAQVTYIDMPEDIKDSYQYNTCAVVSKLRKAGFVRPFNSLEDGIAHYLTEFLLRGKYF
ncbi:MAG: ADP-L-glycero-D-manno-heptose-6-epimerase [Chitinophagales bacterium]|nr:MAG: ADP-L-glycero-D-manno-heptose-6-epimerase [Chitinophagales bacterium]